MSLSKGQGGRRALHENKRRGRRQAMGQLAREEWERFQRMSLAEQLELIRFECPVGSRSSCEGFIALQDRKKEVGTQEWSFLNGTQGSTNTEKRS